MPLSNLAREPGFKYGAWLAKVEAEVVKLTGLSTADLDDFLFDNDYEDGFSPRETAKRAIRNAGG